MSSLASVCIAVMCCPLQSSDCFYTYCSIVMLTGLSPPVCFFGPLQHLLLKLTSCSLHTCHASLSHYVGLTSISFKNFSIYLPCFPPSPSLSFTVMPIIAVMSLLTSVLTVQGLVKIKLCLHMDVNSCSWKAVFLTFPH